MKIPLLIATDITKCDAPVVYLHQGDWIIRGVTVEGLILGTSDGPLPLFEGLKIRGDNHVRIKSGAFSKVGLKLHIEAHLC